MTSEIVHERKDTTGMEKGEEQTPHQGPQVWGPTGKTNPPNISLSKPERLNYLNFYYQWGLTLVTLKIISFALREQEGETKQSSPLKRQHNKWPH